MRPREGTQVWGCLARPAPSRAWREGGAPCVFLFGGALGGGGSGSQVIVSRTTPVVPGCCWPLRISDGLYALQRLLPRLRLPFRSSQVLRRPIPEHFDTPRVLIPARACWDSPARFLAGAGPPGDCHDTEPRRWPPPREQQLGPPPGESQANVLR